MQYPLYLSGKVIIGGDKALSPGFRPFFWKRQRIGRGRRMRFLWTRGKEEILVGHSSGVIGSKVVESKRMGRLEGEQSGPPGFKAEFIGAKARAFTQGEIPILRWRIVYFRR